MNEAVTDAGPLIHLAEINCLSLLCVLDAVHVPDVVWSESVRPGRIQEADLRLLDNLHRHVLSPAEVTQYVNERSLMHLHAGEQEALCLSHKMRISTLLTDDLAVRDAARQQDLKPIGSLGVIVRAYHQGCLSLDQAEHFLAELYATSSLFVTWAIVELAIEKLRDLRE